MDLYHSTDARGITELNPDAATLRRILDELDSIDTEEADHPDASLVHDSSGWSISVFPSGVVTFENLDQPDEPPRYMHAVSRNAALSLWLDLAQGRIPKLQSQPWNH